MGRNTLTNVANANVNNINIDLEINFDVISTFNRIILDKPYMEE